MFQLKENNEHRKDIFNWCLKKAFRKLYNKEVEKENIFILSESVKKEIEKGRLSNKWFNF